MVYDIHIPVYNNQRKLRMNYFLQHKSWRKIQEIQDRSIVKIKKAKIS